MTQNMLKALTTNIRYYRKRAKLTQQELGEKCGVSMFVVSNWEKETTIPDAVQIALICDALNVDPAVLLGIADESATRDELDEIILTRYRAVPDHVRMAVNALLGIELG